jgi:hypothetical protein
MRNLSKLFLLTSSGGGGSHHTDSATIGTKTRIISNEVSPVPTDTATIKGKTTISGVEVPNFDNALILSTTTLQPMFIDTYHVNTFDYNWNNFDTSYDFDGAIPVSGCVGIDNDDQGFIE